MAIISRSAFAVACKRFAEAPDSIRLSPLGTQSYTQGWTWSEHPVAWRVSSELCSVVEACGQSAPGYGSLDKRIRRTTTPRDAPAATEEDVEEATDNAAVIDTSPPGLLTVHLSIAYSATYQVPVLYFHAVDGGGAPLALEALLNSSLFRAHQQEYPFTTARDDLDSDEPGSAQFPIVSAGDHPTTGRPCFFFHPCNTSALLHDVLTSEPSAPDQQDDDFRLLFAWLMLVNSLINLDDGVA